MLFLLLYRFVLSERKQLNLFKYFKGYWNSTIDYMNQNGEFYGDTNSFQITFNPIKNNILKGTINGFYEYPFDIIITIDPENQQNFSVEYSKQQQNHILATTEMQYYKRNMPIARGKWINNSQHFKILIFNPVNFELSIYRDQTETVEIYRFTKSPVPELEDIMRAVAPPLIVGIIFIGFRLYKVHEYIEEQERKKAQTHPKPQEGNTKPKAQ